MNDCYTHLATYRWDMTGFEPATHHCRAGDCTVYLAAWPLAPQGDFLRNNPLARVQFPLGTGIILIHSPIYIKLPFGILISPLHFSILFDFLCWLTLSLRQRFSAALPALPNPSGLSSPVQYLYRQTGSPPPHPPFSFSLKPRPAPPDPESPAHR